MPTVSVAGTTADRRIAGTGPALVPVPGTGPAAELDHGLLATVRKLLIGG